MERNRVFLLLDMEGKWVNSVLLGMEIIWSTRILPPTRPCICWTFLKNRRVRQNTRTAFCLGLVSFTTVLHFPKLENMYMISVFPSLESIFSWSNKYTLCGAPRVYLLYTWTLRTRGKDVHVLAWLLFVYFFVILHKTHYILSKICKTLRH
jgi:hypothetical protein